MRIALDLRRINNPGIGRYMKCLAEALLAQAPQHHFSLILPPGGEHLIQCRNGHVERLAPDLKYYSIREQFVLPRILRELKTDLLHSPHFLLPLSQPCKSVATIHDVIYLACPDDLPSRIGRIYYRAMMAATVRRAARIITDSQFSRDEIVRYLHADPQKLDVIYPAVGDDFRTAVSGTAVDEVRCKYQIESEYVLYTGIYKPRKNHVGLLLAFRELASATQGVTLVIAGPLNGGEQELRKLAEHLGIQSQVIFTGFVPDSDLRALYSGARVYACPSLYEGFGFTVLEAMACGVPVVCSTAGSLPEVAGGAALFADPRDAKKFGNALWRAFSDTSLRNALIKQGQTNVTRFNWGETAAHTLAVYHEVLQVQRPELVPA